MAQAALLDLAEQLEALGGEIEALERRVLNWHRADEMSRRLATIPGIGPITASAPDPNLFRVGRLLAVGVTAVLRMARQRSTGTDWIRGAARPAKPKAAAVALANKNARIAWVLMATLDETPHHRPSE